jgi:hypothetical protein
VTGDDFNRLLNGSRMLVGAAGILAPGVAFRGAGLDSRSNPQMPFVMRMFGIRDLVLGAGALGTSGAERRRWLQATIASDAVDFGAAIAGLRAGYLPTHGAITLATTAATGTALGIAALASGD